MYYILKDKRPVKVGMNTWATWIAKEKQQIEDGHHSGACRVAWTDISDGISVSVIIVLTRGHPRQYHCATYVGGGQCGFWRRSRLVAP